MREKFGQGQPDKDSTPRLEAKGGSAQLIFRYGVTKPSFVVSDLAAVQRDFTGRRIGFSSETNATVSIRVHRWVRAGLPGFLPQATTLEAHNAT